jgi:hypothetical protein
MPLYFLEVGLGQYLGAGSLTIWSISPICKGGACHQLAICKGGVSLQLAICKGGTCHQLAICKGRVSLQLVICKIETSLLLYSCSRLRINIGFIYIGYYIKCRCLIGGL